MLCLDARCTRSRAEMFKGRGGESQWVKEFKRGEERGGDRVGERRREGRGYSTDILILV